MTTRHAPRLAVALLRRFVPDNEPLVGDLLEEFGTRQSRLWFWRQVLLAVAIRSFQPRDVERPLGLAHGPVLDGESDRTADLPRQVNLTASPIPGIGGLGLVALGVLVAVVRPDAWWIFVPAVLGGIALGVALMIVRRHAPLSRPAAGVGSAARNSDVGPAE